MQINFMFLCNFTLYFCGISFIILCERVNQLIAGSREVACCLIRGFRERRTFALRSHYGRPSRMTLPKPNMTATL